MSDINSLIHDGTIWLLVAFSVVTWGLIVIKLVQTQKANRQSKAFAEEFWSAKNLQDAIQKSEVGQGPVARIANTGFKTLADADDDTHQDLQHSWSRQDLLERHLRKQILSERRQLEKGSALLASIGNNAPFIGLFGTVFGIIHALQAIQTRKAANPKLALNLNADETVPYGTVAKLLASIERVGVDKLSVITSPKS
ncbi:MotA/TolQ/ExbB proton channel family protein [Acinetobacter baumannii]|nr:MotA/TolQ/ExbB proton channel family protein [Acinetobacter baumannii]